MNKKFCLSAANWMFGVQQIILDFAAWDDGRFGVWEFHMLPAEEEQKNALNGKQIFQISRMSYPAELPPNTLSKRLKPFYASSPR